MASCCAEPPWRSTRSVVVHAALGLRGVGLAVRHTLLRQGKGVGAGALCGERGGLGRRQRSSCSMKDSRG